MTSLSTQQHEHDEYFRHLADGAELQHAIVQSHMYPPEVNAKSLGATSHRFVQKLHSILNNPEYHAYIAWLPNKDAWHVLDRQGLEEHVLPRNFRSCRFRSFMRQVNAWSFERIRKGSDRGAYFHDYFLRNDPDVSFKMVHPRMLRHLLAPVVQLSNNNRYLYPRPVPPGIAMLRRGEANNNVCIYPAMNMQHRAGALVPAVCSSENIAADGPIAYHENVAGGGDIPPVRSENIDAGGGDIPPVRSENFDAGGIPPVRSENIDAGDIPPVRSSDIAADGIPPVRSENTAAGGGIPPVRSETIAAGGIPPVRNENIAAGGGIPPVRSENNVAGGIPPVRSENIAAGGIAPVRSETVISGDIPFARNKQAAAGGLNVTVTTAPYTALEESRLQVSSSDSDSIVKVVSARKRPKTTTRSEDRLHALADLCFQAEQNDNVLQRKV